MKNPVFPRPFREAIENAPDSVVFNGIEYYKDDSGYYVHGSRKLHREIWKYYRGDIPDGYHIHHIDRNTTNNDISNLMCLSPEDHSEIHKQLLTEEEREWSRNNLINNANPASKMWHKSPEGKKWHSEHTKKNRENGCYVRELVCSYCGKHYIGEPYSNTGNHFCSNRCKVAFRRKSGIDDEPRICQWCGKEFMANKRKGTKTCSKECRYKLLSKTLSDKANNC